MATRAKSSDGLEALRSALGAALAVDAESLRLAGQDVFTEGPLPVAVFRPDSVEALAAGVAAATGLGHSLVPRGGGMSYTSGYVAGAPGHLAVDLARLDRIVSIDPEDRRVTVEAGCTWASLHAALKPLGLRVPAWGTLSGIRATVGGGMSQNGVFWGARGGPIAGSALGFDVVLADGRILSTNRFPIRGIGPDLTGLFAADCGALGIKARITLPLVPEAEALAYASFSFARAEGFLKALADLGRAGTASEVFGFDPFLQAQRMKRDSLAADAKALIGTMKAQGGFWKGLAEGARVAAAGRNFLEEGSFSLHAICEGRSAAAAEADADAVRAICRAAGGTEVENSIPKVLRANPFPPVNSMLGPSGERWVPVHGILRASAAQSAYAAIEALHARHAQAMADLGVTTGALFLALGPAAVLIEPVYYWPDSWQAIHRQSVEPAHLARLTEAAANPPARALVERLRAELIELFGRFGAGHFQLGRAYPLAGRLDPAALTLLRALKASLDPQGRMNPGVLGL
ncbi:MAG: FAD-binding oxidoreductase [Sphingomonadaceae bacterium]